jgi:hypothetical protein
MSIAPAKSVQETESQPLRDEGGNARKVIAWSSFFFALLQSVCTFFTALDGLRLVIGISSLAVGAAVGGAIDKLHADRIRVPMILLALAGSLLNLVVLWQVRRLRKRPASQWRQKPVSLRKLRMERVQFVLSVATLVLIALEEYFHFGLKHHL